MADMTDNEALNFLAGKLQSKAALAQALGITPQRLSNWYERGISAAMRPKVWATVNDCGGHLPREWMTDRAEARAQ